MGIATRREREKEEMRQRILDAAHAIFKEKGYDGLNIRNIAEAIEYSPATIYLYYKDKNEIYFDLQYEGSIALRNHVLPAADIEDPMKRLEDFGRRYIDFGLNHPDWYDLLFITRKPMEHIENQDCWKLGTATHSFFLETVQACVDRRYFKSTDSDTIAYLLWCYAHGLVSLFVRERMRMYDIEKRPELAKASFEMLMKIIQTL
jgi:AcrR family transcriptional regulator